VRRDARRPLRVFLQGGSRDLNNAAGNWWLANQEMADALAFAGYDHHTVWGDNNHSLAHGGAVFPDTMRWLWRDYVPGS
jgi:enterochelin esterase family protein